MKTKFKLLLLLLVAIGLTACGTTSISTTTNYDENGNITSTVVTENEQSDLASYINAGDGNVTSLNGDISKFNLGYNGIGLSWFSISGGRQKAPVNDESDSAEALEKIAEVVKATKTSIVTETLGVNANPTGTTQETSEEEVSEQEEENSKTNTESSEEEVEQDTIN